MTFNKGCLKFSTAVLLLSFAACAKDRVVRRSGPDVYPDIASLSAANVEGRDFSREAYYRGSQVSVFAIHGGDIEYATSRLARALAGADLNLYIFNGWLGSGSGKLHVTSTRFDDPPAVALSTSALLSVSVHAQAGRGELVCVGGANSGAAEKVARSLAAAGFETEFPCKRLPGVSPRNIVNRSALGGVQLELTLGLLERLENSSQDMSKFTFAVRGAVFQTIKGPAAGEQRRGV